MFGADCNLGDKGAAVLAQALQENTRLDTIELPGNTILLTTESL